MNSGKDDNSIAGENPVNGKTTYLLSRKIELFASGNAYTVSSPKEKNVYGPDRGYDLDNQQ